MLCNKQRIGENMINTERLCLGCMNDCGGEKVCPICGFDSSSQNPANCLPLRFVINDRYYIGKATKINGEGITYIAWDNSSDTIVNIKEYFPKGFAHRNPDMTVSMDSEGKYTFNEGLMEFIEINSHIMKSDLPSLMPIINVFEENGTVYAVSTAIQGIALNDFLKRNGDTLKWEQARALFLPLIDTVKGMNDDGFIHGGISEDTIIVGRDGKLRITDYSIKKLRMLTSELETETYSGFAAAEQYDIVGLHIDTYTDVYGLSATLFKVFIGIIPPDAMVRLQNDSMTIPAKFAEELPRHVLSALANALQVMPENRTADMETFKNELVYGEIEQPVVKKVAEVNNNEGKNTKKKKSGSAKYVIISSVSTALVFLTIACVLVFTVFKDDIFKKDTENSTNETSSIVAPEIDEIGTVDSNAAVSAKMYKIPDFRGKTYSEIMSDPDSEATEVFEIILSDKQYSNEYSKGDICAQSIAPNTEAVRDTKIELVVSLGSKDIKIANLTGLDETSAKLELLKQGFYYDNITVEEKYDEDREPGVVLDQSPKYGETVNTDVAVTIYINSYKGEEDLRSRSTNFN